MKSVLILGAGSDIAVACARKFASEKYNILLAGRNKERFEPLRSDLIIRNGIEAAEYEFDAADFGSHTQFYSSLKNKPDVTICVFGYLGDQAAAQSDWEACEKTINTNYTGAVSILNIIANDYEQKKNGTIIGISSVAGDRGRQSNYIYGSAKAGFSAYLSGLRNRLYKSGANVVTVKPGFVATKMTEDLNLPAPLTASPEQVANDIFKAYKKRKHTLYTKWMWKYIMLIIKNIPEPIFKKLKL